jgi:hypothetical protein
LFILPANAASGDATEPKVPALRMALICLSWGRPEDARALVEKNLEAARQAIGDVAPGAPEYKGLQFDLAVALKRSAWALGGFKDKDYASILRDLTEAASLLRPLVKELPEVPTH